MKHLRFLTSSAFVAAFAASSFAQFTEVKGVREFTRELIVKPKSVDAMMDSGVSMDSIRFVRQRSRSRIASFAKRYVPQTDEYIVRVPIGSTDSGFAQLLQRTGDYQYVVPNWRVFPTIVPNDPRYAQQWHHPVIGAPAAWDIFTGTSDRIVAFGDTGIKTSHEDLKGLRVPGYNAVDRKAEVDGGAVEDINGHGTHVSGCGAAQGNNGIGVSGVAWNMRVMHVRVSNSTGGGASHADMLDGARWAIEHGAKSFSLSYSGVDNPAIDTTATYIKSIGGVLLYAAGNDDRDLNGFRHQNTIVVGASAPGDVKADFSAYGRGCTLFAPGVNILSTTMDGGYGFASGTSMATPVANGALAAMWSLNPDLTPDEIMNIFYTTCDNIGPSTIFGYGRINVGKGMAVVNETLAKDASVVDVQTQTGAYVSGNLSSVTDASTVSSFNVEPIRQVGLGAVASSTVTLQIPVASNRVRSIQATAVVNSLCPQATTVFVYAFNRSTSQWELVGSRGTYGGVNTTHTVNIRTNVPNYMDASGNVNLMYRAVTPARLSPSLGNFRVAQVKARYTARTVTP